MLLRSKIRYQLLSLAGVVLITSICNYRVYACRCGRPSPEVEFKQSQAVFAGKVVAIYKPGVVAYIKRKLPFLKTDPLDEFSEVKMIEVSRVWKGEQHSKIVIKDRGWIGFCGERLVPGKEYLIYAINRDSGLINTMCSRTGELIHADEDLAFLGVGNLPLKQRETDSRTTILWAIGVLLMMALIGLLAVTARKRKSEKAEPNIDDGKPNITR